MKFWICITLFFAFYLFIPIGIKFHNTLLLSIGHSVSGTFLMISSLHIQAKHVRLKKANIVYLFTTKLVIATIGLFLILTTI